MGTILDQFEVETSQQIVNAFLKNYNVNCSVER